MKTAILFAVISLLAMALPLQGQSESAPVEISPFYGYLFGGTVANVPQFPGAVSSVGTDTYRLADHTTYGLSVGYNVGPHFEPELQWSHTEIGLRRSGVPSGPGVCFDRDCFKIDYFLGGVAYNFGRSGIRPYVSFSLGEARLSPTYSYSQDFTKFQQGSDERFTGALGVGVKAFVTRSLGFRVNLHGYATRIAGIAYGPVCTTVSNPEPGQSVVPVTAPCPTKTWLYNSDVTGGLLLAF